MSIRTSMVVALALVFGGSAAMGINSLRNQAPSGPKPDSITVVVALGDIPRFTTLSTDLVATRDCPKDMVPAGAVTQIDDIIGRVTYTPLVKDEPVLDGKLTPKGAGRGMAAVVPKGMRAFTIQTPNVASGVAGFILPGSKVDVLLTVCQHGNNDTATGGGSTCTLLQNVEILAVDQRVEAPADNRVDTKDLRSVTLLVTPDQAARLDLGQNKGVLHLSLRNALDEDHADSRPATLADLQLYQEKPKVEPKEVVVAQPPQPRRPPPPLEIRTLRGSQEGSVFVQPPTPESNRP